MQEQGFKWYAMRAVSGKEAKLKEYIEKECSHNPELAKHVAQVLLPMEKHAVLKNGKRVIKQLTLCVLCLTVWVSWVEWTVLHLYANQTLIV